MPKPTHLLWLDLETTGVDELQDEILEIGVILTDLELTGIGDATIVLPLTEFGMDRLLRNEYVLEMHERNGLLAASRDIAQRTGRGFNYASYEARQQALSDACREVIGLLEESKVKAHKVMLAGSGVSHFDRRFVKAQLPALEAQLAYPNLDVGVLRRAFELFAPDLVTGLNGSKDHRALGDVQLHLAEMQAYAEVLGATQAMAALVGDLAAHYGHADDADNGGLFIGGVDVPDEIAPIVRAVLQP